MGYKYKKNLKLKIVLRLQLLIAFVSIINQNIYSAAKIKVSRDSNAKDVHAQILSAIRNSNKAKLNKLLKQEGSTPNVLLALSELIRMGDRNGVGKLLIESGIDINIACKNGAPALSLAVIAGHIEIVKLLLELGADINNPDIICNTPLMWAAHYNRIEIAKLLIKAHADINIVNSRRNANALKIACFNGNLNMVKFLLKHGSNYEVFSLKDIEFLAADTEKIRRDKIEIIKLLSQARLESEKAKAESGKRESKEPDAGNELKGSRSSESCNSKDLDLKLRASLERGGESLKKTQELLKKEADHLVWLRNNNKSIPMGNSPALTQLYVGIDMGDIELVKKSLKEIPDINCMIAVLSSTHVMNQVCPLIIALRGKIEIIKLLIEAGADVNIIDTKTGLTPLFFAADSGCRIETIDLLIKSGANVNVSCTSRGFTPLHYAANAEIVDALVKAGANIEAKSFDLYTPLHQAAKDGRQAAFDALIAAGANVLAKAKYQDNCFVTPFDLLVQGWKFGGAGWHFGILVSILEQGIRLEPKEEATVSTLLNINGKSGDLIRNIIFNKVNIVDALLKMRRITEADINWQDNSGMNAIMWAVVRCPELVFKLLMYCRINLYQADLSLANCKGQTALSLAVKHSKDDIVNCIEGYLLGRKDFIKNLLTTNGLFPKINDLVTSYLFGQSNHESPTDKVENSAMHESAVGIEQLLTYLSYANTNTSNSDSKDQVIHRSDKKLNNLLSKSIINIDKNITGKTESKEPVNALNSPSESMSGGNLELILAAKSNNHKLLKEIINQGVDVNIPDKDGHTALIDSAYKGYNEIVQLLIDAGANIDYCTNKGNSALIVATMFGHVEVVKSLLKANADINISNIYDKQAIHYAKEKRLLDSIEVKKNKLRIFQILSLHAISEAID